MAAPPIASRVPRAEYESRIRPRSVLRVLVQKLLHQQARVCIPPGLRLTLYRWMGISIGRHCFVGLDTWLDDQFPVGSKPTCSSPSIRTKTVSLAASGTRNG